MGSIPAGARKMFSENFYRVVVIYLITVIKENYITASLLFEFVSRFLELILFGVYPLVEAA